MGFLNRRRPQAPATPPPSPPDEEAVERVVAALKRRDEFSAQIRFLENVMLRHSTSAGTIVDTHRALQAVTTAFETFWGRDVEPLTYVRDAWAEGHRRHKAANHVEKS